MQKTKVFYSDTNLLVTFGETLNHSTEFPCLKRLDLDLQCSNDFSHKIFI